MKLSQLLMVGALIIVLPMSGQAVEVPLDPQVVVPSAPYQSAFADYKSYQDPELVPWRIANDEIGQTGGMAGHDMSGMKGMGGQEKMKTMPGHDMKDMKGMDGMKGMNGKEKMTDMPGHDMGSMRGNAASPPAAKPAPSAGKPVERAPQAMPDHNGMQKQ